MKRYAILLAVTVLSTGILNGALPDMPMPVPQADTMDAEWAAKTPKRTLKLSGMESLERWEHEGYGMLALSADRSVGGKSSLLLTSPTKGEISTVESDTLTEGRPWGGASAIYKVPLEDWSEWNRITLWVYPDLPGFKVVALSLVFHNEGAEKVPGPYNRNGLNFKIVENHKWNKVYWEIEHLGRDKVSGVELRYRLQGNEPGATETVKYYFDELMLEAVEPDHYEGWDVAPGQLAYNHLGYPVDFPKRALATDLSAGEFKVLNAETGQPALEKDVETLESELGSFQVLDFSEIRDPGTYFLVAGEYQSRPFKIDSFANLYRETGLKTINHFYSQRCGTHIPGIHDACHRDWLGTHGDRSMLINGGWHDAGDLSQGLVNTAESVHALFTLAKALESTDPLLAERLAEEGEWGLDWVLKTRFGDGYRIQWSTMDFWTDGIIGTIDDVPSQARNSALGNLVAGKAQASAAGYLAAKDPVLSNYALRSAEADWRFALEQMGEPNLERAGYALTLSLKLFELTGSDTYQEEAFRQAQTILECQQVGPLSEGVPFEGFFYESPAKARILHYNHRGHEQEPVVGLAQLYRRFPDHPQAPQWRNALESFGAYYKTICAYNAPYFMIPAGIYDLHQAADEVEREQIRSGIALDERYFLKRFPVWKAFRGNSGTILSQAKALSEVANLLDDDELRLLAYRQLEWHLGVNPFAQSLMFGVGHRYGNQYSSMSGDLVGGLPVGVQTHFNRDAPYWSSESAYNWKEIWVHPSARWLWLMSDF